jgi:hypothetical protein
MPSQRDERRVPVVERGTSDTTGQKSPTFPHPEGMQEGLFLSNPPMQKNLSVLMFGEKSQQIVRLTENKNT